MSFSWLSQWYWGACCTRSASLREALKWTGFVLDLRVVIFNPKDLMVIMDYICTEDDLHSYRKMRFPDISPCPISHLRTVSNMNELDFSKK
jgi:hypothetical protein